MESSFCPWWAGHQIQSLFNAVPQIESILKIVPGLYSFWLRCWGSKVGKGVYWTSGSVHYDRNLLEIGHGALFGELSISVCHVITPKDNKALLMIAKVKVGHKSFIGAGSVLSPGVRVDDQVMISAGTKSYPKWHFTQSEVVKPAR